MGQSSLADEHESCLRSIPEDVCDSCLPCQIYLTVYIVNNGIFFSGIAFMQNFVMLYDSVGNVNQTQKCHTHKLLQANSMHIMLAMLALHGDSGIHTRLGFIFWPRNMCMFCSRLPGLPSMNTMNVLPSPVDLLQASNAAFMMPFRCQTCQPGCLGCRSNTSSSKVV